MCKPRLSHIVGSTSRPSHAALRTKYLLGGAEQESSGVKVH